MGKTTVRVCAHAVGYLTLISVIVWAATGVGWWIPMTSPQDEGRMMVLFILHFIGLLVPAFYEVVRRSNE